tara:strand:+ start:9355 stop:9552 length:198 start_codon:yes stop_codon:yes gene_type:complete
MEFPMTTTQARAIKNARKQFNVAKQELNRLRLRETSYRGIPTILDNDNIPEIHGKFVYRGRTYTK